MCSQYLPLTLPPPVPGAPLSVDILDVGPSSARVEWTPSTLPADDGGSPLLTVRLTYRMVEGQEEGEWSQAVLEDVGRGFAVVTGLMDQTTYQIRMQVGNVLGTPPMYVDNVMYLHDDPLPYHIH